MNESKWFRLSSLHSGFPLRKSNKLNHSEKTEFGGPVSNFQWGAWTATAANQRGRHSVENKHFGNVWLICDYCSFLESFAKDRTQHDHDSAQWRKPGIDSLARHFFVIWPRPPWVYQRPCYVRSLYLTEHAVKAGLESGVEQNIENEKFTVLCSRCR